MKIIIVGKNSFIGRSFIDCYNNEHEIREICTLSNNLEQIDLTNNDVVIHVAAIVHQTESISEEIYYKVNRDLAFNMARKAKKQGINHFIFMSTAKVFGESTTNKPAWDENSVCNPLDPYGKSKYEAEKLLLDLQEDNFKVAIIRSPLVYGVGVKANMYNLVKLVNRFPVLPLGGINNRRSMVYVGNLVALLRHIIEKQASGIFIAGDRTPLSTTQLTQLIATSSNKKVFLIRIPAIMLDLAKKIKPSIIDRLYGSLVLDNSLTNKRLDFFPPYSSEEGIREMVDWYKTSYSR